MLRRSISVEADRPEVDLLEKRSASSAAMPRYRTVLSSLVCPSSSWAALWLPVEW